MKPDSIAGANAGGRFWAAVAGHVTSRLSMFNAGPKPSVVDLSRLVLFGSREGALSIEGTFVTTFGPFTESAPGGATEVRTRGRLGGRGGDGR